MLFHLLSVLGLVPTFQKTKCKRLLTKTTERIKLLEKRRQARLRQLHRDVIELLKLGKQYKVQPWLLRIWKELCLFSVYIQIEDYCQFVQVNLKDIAGQRECPSGLEEPLAGLCFAASCCADLPELQELREIFGMKYGRQFVNSAQDLQPNCHVNPQFLECLCVKEPSEKRKQALLEEITTQYNVKQGHEQDTQQHEIHDTLSIEGFADTNECNKSQEGIDDTMKVSEVEEDRSEREESKEVDVVQESNQIETVCEEDLGSKELANEVANRKRTLEDREMRRSALKRAYRRSKFWLNTAMEEEKNGREDHEKTTDKAHDCVDKNQGEEVCNDTGRRIAKSWLNTAMEEEKNGREDHEKTTDKAHDCVDKNQGEEICNDAGRRIANVHRDGDEGCGALQGESITALMNEGVAPNEDAHILLYFEQPSCSQPPQRPPLPPPPPKRAPPPPPSLRVVSMPSSYNEKQVIANISLPLSCSTMANNYYLETNGSHVHPRLPRYEELVSNFTARKR